jgi:hypothetical protein
MRHRRFGSTSAFQLRRLFVVTVTSRSILEVDGRQGSLRGRNTGEWSASTYLPIFALSEDSNISGLGRDALRAVEHKIGRLSTLTVSTYAFQREMLRSLVESGDRRFTNRLVDLVRRRGLPVFEREFLTRYGWPRRSLRENIERKLCRPTRRDENLRELYQVMGDGLLRAVK